MDGAGAEGDELAMLEQQLALRAAQLQAIGVAPRAAQGPMHEQDGRQDRERSLGAAATSADQPEAARAPKRASEPTEDMAPTSGRCTQVCDIAEAICTLERQICGLVPRHPDDPRYQAACERAAGDCRFATEACHACS